MNLIEATIYLETQSLEAIINLEIVYIFKNYFYKGCKYRNYHVCIKDERNKLRFWYKTHEFEIESLISRFGPKLKRVIRSKYA